MKSWLFWAGLSFVGGMISFGLTFGATGFISIADDFTGYSIGWIVVGIVLIIFGLIKKQ